MNLRLDSKSVRIRVSHQEAMLLFRNGMLEERLPIPGGSLHLRLESISEEPMVFTPVGTNSFVFQIPRPRLDGMLAKKEIALRDFFQSDTDSIEIFFEIDRFTVPRIISRQKKENRK